MDGLGEVQPIRFPRFWYWIPFAFNVALVLGYAVFVVGPWLGWFAEHGMAACYVDNGCQGPDTVQIPHSIEWLFAPFAIVLFVMAAGPPVSAIVGGFTVLVTGLRLRHGRTGRRIATFVSGLALVGIAIFQATPMGGMFTAWLID
jgi:hypothetical protein